MTDHMEHGVGCTDAALDVKERVAWAWEAVKTSPSVKRRAVTMLTLDVQAGTVNGKKVGKHAELLQKSSLAAGHLLPLVAKSWDPEAPSTLRGNIAAKIGAFEKVKRKSLSKMKRRSFSCRSRRKSGSVEPETDSDSNSDCDSEALENDDDCTVEGGCALPMTDLKGAKRAAQAMLIASIFAAELSNKERTPVVVFGRPPGHHATCAHCLALGDPKFHSPGGFVEGASLGGGCFYPSCWLAAIHCLREGLSQRLAYIDVDAHKPDGVWKEVDHLSKLGNDKRLALLGSQAKSCEGVLFASIHVDGYPKPDNISWSSAASIINKSPKRAFDIRVHEELLPKSMCTRSVHNGRILGSFDRWENKVSSDLRCFKPNGTFVGLGFDLHRAEKNVNDKAEGLGITRKHYRKVLRNLPVSALQGPVVLTLEGGYTEAALKDGIHGALEGLEGLSRKLQVRSSSSKRSTGTSLPNFKRRGTKRLRDERGEHSSPNKKKIRKSSGK